MKKLFAVKDIKKLSLKAGDEFPQDDGALVRRYLGRGLVAWDVKKVVADAGKVQKSADANKPAPKKLGSKRKSAE